VIADNPTTKDMTTILGIAMPQINLNDHLYDITYDESSKELKLSQIKIPLLVGKDKEETWVSDLVIRVDADIEDTVKQILKQIKDSEEQGGDTKVKIDLVNIPFEYFPNLEGE